MPAHPVIDPAFRTAALDVPSALAFALAFAVVAFLTRRDAAYGVALLVASVPFDFSRALGPTTVTLPKVALLAVALGLALARAPLGVLRGRAALALGAAGAAVLVATAISIASADHRGPALRETFKALDYLALFAVVVVATRARYDEPLVRTVLTGSVALVAVLALVQEVAGAPSGMWFAGRPIPRIAGPLEGPNQLSGYLGIALCALTAFALARRPRGFERLALGLGSAALVLTVSRAAIPATLAGIAVVTALSPRRPLRVLAVPVAAGAAAGVAVLGAWGYANAHGFAGLDVLGRFSTLAESEQAGTVGKRSQLWRAAVTLWRSHPWLGIGAGNFELELGRAGFPGLRTHANSLYLQSLAEGGLPLFAAALASLLAPIVRLRNRAAADPVIAAAVGATAGLALHQAFDFLAFYPKVGDLWWIVLGLGAARYDAVADASVGSEAVGDAEPAAARGPTAAYER